MAYFRYNRTCENGNWRFVRKGRICLYGYKNGLVANALRQQGLTGKQEPWEWHINVSKAVQQLNYTGDVFVIDLMPSQREKKKKFSFFELLDVWGYSSDGWTPALLRLRCLLSDDCASNRDYNDFTIDPKNVGKEPIFTFAYFRGSIKGGETTGKWLPTGPASANAVLLWPKVAKYFTDIITGHLPPLDCTTTD